MGKTTGYSLQGYGSMITDRARMEPYAQALRQVVHSGAVVVDIGAGTGIFSMLACQAGASQVHAVEPDESIHLARSIAAANGFAERITFHQSLSTNLILPAPADVIVSDLRSVLPLFQRHIPSIIDARTRLLAPGGQLIPQADEMWAAIVEDAELHRSFTEPWARNRYDLDMRAGHEPATSTWGKANLTPDKLLVAPQRWATLDYTTIDDTNVAGELEWTVERAGTGHGVALWFETTLAPGIGFSNAPGEPKIIYGQAFFPWPEPVTLQPGDAVGVALRANLVGDDYVWRWQTRVRGRDAHAGEGVFDQSTLLATALAPGHLRKQAAEYAPTLDLDGEVEHFMLAAMDGKNTLAEIAHRAVARFPGHFASWKQALTEAGRLAVKFAR